MFEKALGVLNPYSGLNQDDAGDRQTLSENGNSPEASRPEDDAEPGANEIETLKAELTAMQDKLDQISKRSTK